MRRSTKYGLVGIGALTALSLAHSLRSSRYGGGGIWLYVLGVVAGLGVAWLLFVFLTRASGRVP